MSSERINWILDALQDLNYDISNETVESYNIMFQEGIKNLKFRVLVSDLLTELAAFSNYQCKIAMDTERSFSEHALQVMKQIGLPNVDLANFEEVVSFVEFLIPEVQACRMLSYKESSLGGMQVDKISLSDAARYQVQSRNTASAMIQSMATTLAIPIKPDLLSLLVETTRKVQMLLSQLPPTYLGEPILSLNSLPQKHVKLLEDINVGFKQEYEQRKQVLLKRLEVTLQAFLWSAKGEEHKVDLKELLRSKSLGLTAHTDISVYTIFTARPDIVHTALLKTSGKQVSSNTHSSIKTLLIGPVPDRGGRVDERRISAMPTFKERESHDPKPQREVTTSGGKLRVHGSFNQPRDDNNQDNFKKTAGRGNNAWGGKAKRGRGQQQYY